MPSRRKIREATVQLLYAREARPAERDEEEIWRLIHEHSLITWDRARLKLLTHWQQARPSTVEKFHNVAHDASSAINLADPDGKLARKLSKHLQQERQWCDKLESLPRLVKADLGRWQDDLRRLLADIAALTKSREALRGQFTNFPPALAEALETICAKLQEFDQRARQLINPLAHPKQRELAHLRQSQLEMNALEEAARELAARIENEQESLDRELDAAAENFDLKRFSRVDLAILRLAAWEIHHGEDLTPAIIINEAVEMAKRFGATRSASFVNGLLDHIAKNNTPPQI
ncbi:MAG: transcription antitermination factor NusB [Verrucomicrobiales bacterium]